MFSDFEIPVGTDTVEYAWLMEITCGDLTGKFTPLQVATFFFILELSCNIFSKGFIVHIY